MKSQEKEIAKLQAKIKILKKQKSIAKAPMTRAAVEEKIRELETKKAVLMKKLAA